MNKLDEIRERWAQPPWMNPFVEHLANTAGWCTPDHAMNCDSRDCNLVVNAPRAMICIAVSSQVALLLRLRDAGLLPTPPTTEAGNG